MINNLNNRGQTLVIFIILLPLVCFIMFFFIQKLMLINEKTYLKSIANDSCNYYLKNNNIDKTIELLKKNDSNLKNIVVNDELDTVMIEFDKEINDLFDFFEDNKIHIKVTCNR